MEPNYYFINADVCLPFNLLLFYDWDLEGGRKLFIIPDQNMPPMLPSKKGMCPAVLLIDGGHLRELGTNFLTILGRYAGLWTHTTLGCICATHGTAC
jgi:hypothetical protein